MTRTLLVGKPAKQQVVNIKIKSYKKKSPNIVPIMIKQHDSGTNSLGYL